VGRKSVMSKLSDEDRATVIARGKAIAIEKGCFGSPNVAAAAQEMATHPDLPHELREHLHGAHASKSYVTPSFRQAHQAGPSHNRAGPAGDTGRTVGLSLHARRLFQRARRAMFGSPTI
jgi:hypothetical protein